MTAVFAELGHADLAAPVVDELAVADPHAAHVSTHRLSDGRTVTIGCGQWCGAVPVDDSERISAHGPTPWPLKEQPPARVATAMPAPEVPARPASAEEAAGAPADLLALAEAAGWTAGASYARGPRPSERSRCGRCGAWVAIVKSGALEAHAGRVEDCTGGTVSDDGVCSCGRAMKPLKRGGFSRAAHKTLPGGCENTELDPSAPTWQMVSSVVVRATSPAGHRIAAVWVDGALSGPARLALRGDRVREVPLSELTATLRRIAALRPAEGPVAVPVVQETPEPVPSPQAAPEAVPAPIPAPRPAPLVEVVAPIEPVVASDVVTLYHGDCLDVLRQLPDCSVDAVVTDPPYGLSELKPAVVTAALAAWLAGDRSHVPDARGFMGRRWDAFVPPPAVWDECLRVLKPGGHLLAFAGSRTGDLMGLSVRLAGFEIRDEVSCWINSQGFPKGKSQLKPAHEPIIVARKPLAGSIEATVARYGTGGLNIDACRVAHASEADRQESEAKNQHGKFGSGQRNNTIYGVENRDRTDYEAAAGRWPSNVVFAHAEECGPDDSTPCVDGCPVFELDAQSVGTRAEKASAGGSAGAAPANGGVYAGGKGVGGGAMVHYADSGGASRFFPTFRYQAKAPTKERPEVNGVKHPTVKPVALMEWLVRLVTPGGGTVLEPFAGSGTTVEAAINEGRRVIAVEREADYVPLIEARIARALPQDGAA